MDVAVVFFLAFFFAAFFGGFLPKLLKIPMSLSS